MFSNVFIVFSTVVEAVAVSFGREGRNNGSSINIHFPLMSHFQTHEVSAKKINGINVTLIRAQISKIPKVKALPPVNLDLLPICI